MVDGSLLLVQDSAMMGEVEMIETYRGTVSLDRREIHGRGHDLGTSTGRAYRCAFHMVRR